MSMIDIRDDVVSKIMVTDNLSLTPKELAWVSITKGITIQDCVNMKIVLCGKAQVQDMIKALQKAIELGWVDEESQ